MTAEMTAKKNNGHHRGSKAPKAPKALVAAVRGRYNGLVQVTGPRKGTNTYGVRIAGVTRAVTSAMFVTDAGLVYFDDTNPTIRRRELHAARQLEQKGYTKKADEIRRRVSPELLLDERAVRHVMIITRTLGAVREVLTATGTRSVWHRHFERGAEYSVITLDIGRGRRIRGGTTETVDNDGGLVETPWYALDKGSTEGAKTAVLAEIMVAIA